MILSIIAVISFIGITIWTFRTKRSAKTLPFIFAFIIITLSVGFLTANSTAKGETARQLQSDLQLTAILAEQTKSAGHSSIRLDGSTVQLTDNLEADYQNWNRSRRDIVGVQTVRKTPNGKLQKITEFGTSEYLNELLSNTSTFAQTWRGSSQITQLPNNPAVSVSAAPIFTQSDQTKAEALLIVTFLDKNWQQSQFAAQKGVIVMTTILLLLTLVGGVAGIELIQALAEARIAKAEMIAQREQIKSQMDVITEKNQIMAASHDALEQANSKLQSLATMDGLTGVMNHRALMDFLSTHMKRNSVIGSPSSVILLDIDNFKSLNDQYGHIAGDEALRTIAQVLKLSCPAGAGVGRYGGEEFMMVLPGGSESAAEAVAEELRRRIQMAKTTSRPVTASIGVSTVYSLSKSEQTLIDEADKALYVAKRSGKNCVRHFGHGMLESA
jgi:diguanylate cyclase (GGDEF)-like protein